jgi:hypothetical protein
MLAPSVVICDLHDLMFRSNGMCIGNLMAGKKDLACKVDVFSMILQHMHRHYLIVSYNCPFYHYCKAIYKTAC